MTGEPARSLTAHPKAAGSFDFFAGGGEMGERIRTHDWGATPLGKPDRWPQPLKTIVGIMLGSSQPMFVAWGPERILIYNEPYSQILAGKHPHALGQPFLDVWREIRNDLVPIVDQAFAGGSVQMDDITLAVVRRGYLEEAHFAFSYTPVRSEQGQVDGLFCACTETTGQVQAERRLRENEARLRGVLDGMGEAFILLDPRFRVVEVNDEALRLEKRPREAIIGRTHWELWPGTEDSELGGLYKRAMVDRVAATQEHLYCWPDGTSSWLDVRAYPVDDGLALFYRDVTERRRAADAVREAAERIELALNSGAIIGTWVWDVVADRFVADERFGYSFGIDPALCNAGLPLDAVADSIHHEDRERVLAAVAEAMERGGQYRCEYRVVDSTGSLRWVEANGRVEFGSEGSPVRFPGVLVDVAERRAAEEALRQSEARLRVAQAAGGVGTFELIPDAGRILVSPEFCRIWGVPAVAECDVSDFLKLIHSDDQERVRTGETVLPQQALDPIEYRIVRPDTGELRWIARRGEAVRDESGTTRYMGVCFDITERKQAEVALRDLNATLELRVAERTAERDRAWRATQDVLATVSAEGKFIAVNPAWTRVLGYEEAETVGRNFSEFIHPDDEAATMAAVEHSTRDVLLRFENRYRHKDGTLRWFSWKAAPEGDYVYASGRDITAERQAAEELALAQQALRQSQKMEAMGQLTGGVAHDFNNLLTPIIGGLDLLYRKGVGSEREQRLVEGALQSAERAKTLVQRLLAFARRQPLQMGPVDIGELVRGMVELIGSTSGPNISIVTEIGENLPFARADANQLEMAILNLAVNSRDAMPGGGTLTISARPGKIPANQGTGLPPGPYICLSVADTGRGMDEETLAHAVEPFFSTKGLGRGTGLGLSMVHGLAGQLGGALSLKSVQGEGTTAELWLPVSTETPKLAADAAAGTVPSEAQAGTALLVDDEPLVRASTADMLGELGYKVLEAESAEQALQMLSDPRVRGSIDLMISDHLMPGLSGTELARRVSATGPKVPVIIISGYAELDGLPSDLPRLTKPFRQSDLRDAISQLRGA